MATARLGNASMLLNQVSVTSELVGLPRLSLEKFLPQLAFQDPAIQTYLRGG